MLISRRDYPNSRIMKMRADKVATQKWRFTTLHWAVMLSLAIHAFLLTIRFVNPERFNKLFQDTPLEVILVNAKSGLYFGTIPNAKGLLPSPVPHQYRRHEDGISVVPMVDYPIDKVVEIDAAGTGALLVHRSVLEAIRDAADPSEGDAWCWFRDLPINGMWWGEDLYFCKRVRALEFPIHAHTGAVFSDRREYWLDDRQHRMVRAVQEGNDG